MKTFPAFLSVLNYRFSFILLVFWLLFSSCKAYHRMSTLPVVPDFKQAGELDGSIAINKGFLHFQGSASVTNFMGVYYNGLRESQTFVDGTGLILFHALGKEKNLRLFSSIGYERGQFEVYLDENPINFSPSYTSKYTFKSAFELYKFSLGLTFGLGERKKLRIGMFMNMQDVQLFRLYTYHYKRESGSKSEWSHTNATPEKIKIWSPVISLTYTFGRELFYFRMMYSRDNINRSQFSGKEPYVNYNPNNPRIMYRDVQMEMRSPVYYFSLSFGMHVDIFHCSRL